MSASLPVSAPTLSTEFIISLAENKQAPLFANCQRTDLRVLASPPHSTPVTLTALMMLSLTWQLGASPAG